MIETARAVRAWLIGLPGMVEAKTPEEGLRKAWGAYGGPGSVEDFKASLKAEGFEVEQVGAKFILRLPSPPMEGPNNYHRLHNITGRGRR